MLACVTYYLRLCVYVRQVNLLPSQTVCSAAHENSFRGWQLCGKLQPQIQNETNHNGVRNIAQRSLSAKICTQQNNN